MKSLIFLLLMGCCILGNAQEPDHLQTPKEFVIRFFQAFHAQDTLVLKQQFNATAKLESLKVKENGEVKLTSEDHRKFLKSIASIPSKDIFREEIHEYRVEENGPLATVTTPYTFYYNGKLSHCGINIFQLVRFDEQWKIVYLIDTRSTDNCD